MKFTFEEWGKIRHALEVAQREFEKQMNDSRVSDEQFSQYQIFKRQMEGMGVLIEKITHAEI